MMDIVYLAIASSNTAMIGILIGCCGVILALALYEKNRKTRQRRTRARGLQSCANNQNSSGITPLLNDDNTNNDPMNFSNSQPPPSKIAILLISNSDDIYRSLIPNFTL